MPCVKNELLPSHPLELSEKNVQRLPFLPSSNLSLDILRGNDETIGFEDILNGECHSAPFYGDLIMKRQQKQTKPTASSSLWSL
uniref:Uncharacterized protein n=1 Tax=Canis lupus dingo TaxID=286419 RepID=A0A8C0LGX6_CANLU